MILMEIKTKEMECEKKKKIKVQTVAQVKIYKMLLKPRTVTLDIIVNTVLITV